MFIEQCSPGYYSSNGLMSPVNCKTCPKGSYADSIGVKACTQCPSRTTTSDPGAKALSYCQGMSLIIAVWVLKHVKFDLNYLSQDLLTSNCLHYTCISLSNA